MGKNMREGIKEQVSKIEGANLARLRLEKGWTQEHLAEIIKTNVKYISPIENGKRGIGPDMMRRLCAAFEVDEKEFQQGLEEIEVNGEDGYIGREPATGNAPRDRPYNSEAWSRRFESGTARHNFKGLRYISIAHFHFQWRSFGALSFGA